MAVGNPAKCHPDRQNAGKGLCSSCRWATDEEYRERNRRYNAEWHKKNAERHRDRCKRYRLANLERVKKMARESGKRRNWSYSDKRRRYNREYLRSRTEKLASRPRPESCEACGAVPTGEGRKAILHFDHCHSTGEFRGWLCNRCNLVLGLVKDNKELLTSLGEYLEINHVHGQHV